MGEGLLWVKAFCNLAKKIKYCGGNKNWEMGPLFSPPLNMLPLNFDYLEARGCNKKAYLLICRSKGIQNVIYIILNTSALTLGTLDMKRLEDLVELQLNCCLPS